MTSGNRAPSGYESNELAITGAQAKYHLSDAKAKQPADPGSVTILPENKPTLDVEVHNVWGKGPSSHGLCICSNRPLHAHFVHFCTIVPQIGRS